MYTGISPQILWNAMLGGPDRKVSDTPDSRPCVHLHRVHVVHRSFCKDGTTARTSDAVTSWLRSSATGYAARAPVECKVGQCLREVRIRLCVAACSSNVWRKAQHAALPRRVFSRIHVHGNLTYDLNLVFQVRSGGPGRDVAGGGGQGGGARPWSASGPWVSANSSRISCCAAAMPEPITCRARIRPMDHGK